MTSTEITQQFAFGEDRIISAREWRKGNAILSRNVAIAGLVSVLGGCGLLLARGGQHTDLFAWVGVIAGAMTVTLGGVGVFTGRRRTFPEASTGDLDWSRTLRGQQAEDAYTALRLMWLRGERLRTGKITDSEFEALTRLDRAWLERIRGCHSAEAHCPADETPQSEAADEMPRGEGKTDWIRIAVTAWMVLLFAPFLGAVFLTVQQIGSWL